MSVIQLSFNVLKQSCDFFKNFKERIVFFVFNPNILQTKNLGDD